MPLDLTDDKSTLVQVMAWCHQATSHYLSQCWPRSLLPYDVTRPQWVKAQLWSPLTSGQNTNYSQNIFYRTTFFLQNTHKRPSMTCPSWQQNMECPLWIPSMISCICHCHSSVLYTGSTVPILGKFYFPLLTTGLWLSLHSSKANCSDDKANKNHREAPGVRQFSSE